MTQAYIEGFCKAAEAYGVDPQELMKVAANVQPGLSLARKLLEEGFLTGKVVAKAPRVVLPSTIPVSFPKVVKEIAEAAPPVGRGFSVNLDGPRFRRF